MFITQAGDQPAVEGAMVARELLDMVALDSRIQDEISKYGILKDFHIVLWRQELDADGCNWNARIERIGRARPADSSGLTWWDVVPQLRERYNLI